MAFLREPGLVFLSEGGRKVVAGSQGLVNALGLRLDGVRDLPDIILADADRASTKLVFVAVAVTDGVITAVLE